MKTKFRPINRECLYQWFYFPCSLERKRPKGSGWEEVAERQKKNFAKLWPFWLPQQPKELQYFRTISFLAATAAAALIKVEQNFNFSLAAMRPQFGWKLPWWWCKNGEIANPLWWLILIYYNETPYRKKTSCDFPCLDDFLLHFSLFNNILPNIFVYVWLCAANWVQ